MAIMGFQQPSRPPAGYVQTYYDPKTGQFMRPNPAYSLYGNRKVPQFIPINNFGAQQATTYTPPAVNFNKLPNQVPAGVQVYGAGNQAQPYQRPTMPTTPTGMGYRPQFDPSFIQQMLAQRFGNNQGAGIPTAARPTLTPGATQSYGGYQGQGGLGALRAIANPAQMGGQGETV